VQRCTYHSCGPGGGVHSQPSGLQRFSLRSPWAGTRSCTPFFLGEGAAPLMFKRERGEAARVQGCTCNRQPELLCPLGGSPGLRRCDGQGPAGDQRRVPRSLAASRAPGERTRLGGRGDRRSAVWQAAPTPPQAALCCPTPNVERGQSVVVVRPGLLRNIVPHRSAGRCSPSAASRAYGATMVHFQGGGFNVPD